MTGRRSTCGQIQMPPPYTYSSSPHVFFVFFSSPLSLHFILSSFSNPPLFFIVPVPFLLITSILFTCSLSSLSSFVSSPPPPPFFVCLFLFCLFVPETPFLHTHTHTHRAITQNATLSSNGQKMRVTFHHPLLSLHPPLPSFSPSVLPLQYTHSSSPSICPPPCVFPSFFLYFLLFSQTVWQTEFLSPSFSSILLLMEHFYSCMFSPPYSFIVNIIKYFSNNTLDFLIIIFYYVSFPFYSGVLNVF